MMGKRVAHSVSDSEGTDSEGERGIETGVLNRLLHSRWSGLVALKGSAILLAGARSGNHERRRGDTRGDTKPPCREGKRYNNQRKGFRKSLSVWGLVKQCFTATRTKFEHLTKQRPKKTFCRNLDDKLSIFAQCGLLLLSLTREDS